MTACCFLEEDVQTVDDVCVKGDLLGHPGLEQVENRCQVTGKPLVPGSTYSFWRKAWLRSCRCHVRIALTALLANFALALL